VSKAHLTITDDGVVVTTSVVVEEGGDDSLSANLASVANMLLNRMFQEAGTQGETGLHPEEVE